MIFIEFSSEQGLGNQLWTYSALRAISEIKGYEYGVLKPENFKGSKIMDISLGSKVDYPSKKDLDVYKERLYYDHDLKTFSCDYDEKILNLKPNTILKGLFQSEKYHFKKDIKKYMQIKSIENFNKDKLKNKCILNIRGGEYKRFRDLILPKTYWLNAMKEIKKEKENISFAIVTDDYNYSSKLLPGLEILKGNIKDDFLNLYYSEYLIVSNSSFSYFPIKLGGKAIKVIAPAKWARHNNQLNRWISPANYYSGWQYLDNKGYILSKKTINECIINTQKTYSNYNISSVEEQIKKRSFISLIPKKIRTKIKHLLSKIFPLLIG